MTPVQNARIAFLNEAMTAARFHTLHGNFYTAATLTEGLWQVTFPLENTD